MNNPGWIIEIESGIILQQVHMRFPVGLDGADILPVASEGISVNTFATSNHHWNNVAPEIMLCWDTIFGCTCIFDENTDQRLAIEDINAHRTESAAWFLGFLLK